MKQDGFLLPGVCTLTNQDCIACSDAGIPVRVLALDGEDALCEDAAGNRAQIAVELVAPVQVGEVLLVHGGVAIARAADREARSLGAGEGEGTSSSTPG